MVVKEFPCTKCGACCRMVGHISKHINKDLFPAEWILPDGSCKNLTKENTCGVYKDRPNVCNIRKISQLTNMNEKQRDYFYHENAIMCNTLMDKMGIIGKQIDLTVFGQPLKKETK